MSSEQAASRRLTSRTWIFFLGIFLAVCVYVWPSHSSLSSSIYVARRHLSTGDFGDELEARSNASLLARDTYQCSKEKPCSNGACCGKSGYCGYGPTYCGDGCLSDCGAVAECGQYAKRPGRECPLNTCCSQFGFCGTTEDFCTKVSGARSQAFWSRKCQWVWYLLDEIVLTPNFFLGMSEQLRAQPEPSRWGRLRWYSSEQSHRILRVLERSFELSQSCANESACGCPYTRELRLRIYQPRLVRDCDHGWIYPGKPFSGHRELKVYQTGSQSVRERRRLDFLW